jgi:uncharacterized repeat protein (TIGR01451 family)
MKRNITVSGLSIILLLPMIAVLATTTMLAYASPKSLYLVADHHTAQFDAWEVKPDGTVEYQATHWLSYATDPAGISMDESSVTLFITSEFSGGVEMVDATTMTSLGVSVGPVDLAGIDVDDANDIVYTVQRYPGFTATQPGLLYVYDWNPTAKNLTLRTGYPKTLQNCNSSFGIALDEIRDTLWVADPAAGIVRAYNVTAGLTTGNWIEDTSKSFMPSHKPVDVAVDRLRGFVYTVSMSFGAATPPGTGSNLLSKYDLTTGIEATGTLVDQGVGVSVDEVTGYVYLTLSPYGRGLTQGDLEVWDTSTSPWTLVQTSKVSGSPAGIYVPQEEVAYNPLHLSKRDMPDPVLPSETITYNITYDNLANVFDVHNVILIDYLPTETTFVSASGGGTYDPTNHTVTWTIGTLTALSGPYYETLTVSVKPDTPNMTIVNYVTIDSDETPPTTIYEDTTVYVPPTISVYVDIKPGSWPNPINIDSKGVFAVAICGTQDFNVTTINPATINITMEEIEESVLTIRWSYEDVATPWIGEPGGGHDLEGDGYLDLVLHFKTQEVVNTLGLSAYVNQTVPLVVSGNLYQELGGTPIQGQDYVWIISSKTGSYSE